MSDLSKKYGEIRQCVSEYSEIRMTPDDVISELHKFVILLEASQYQVIQMMVANNIWIGAVPPKPEGEGELELGLLPRWIAYPPDFITEFLDAHSWVKFLWGVLSDLVPNKIDNLNYQALWTTSKKVGVVASDGTLYGENKYEQLDPGWVWSAIDYLIVHFGGDRVDFSDKQVVPIEIKGSSPDKVTIAMLGDWGTGPFKTGAAIEIINQISAMKPDYIIHLGDVYYSGTPGADELFEPPNEEQDNFINYWPDPEQQTPGTSFTLNSNHEMYSGAKGLFNVALKCTGPFSAQQETSYFALKYAGWTLLGLDSAYFSTSPMFMVGSIGVTDDPQPGWIKSLNLTPEKVIVLTHHTGLNPEGTSEPRYPADNPKTFWDEMHAALGGDPAAWYWGHVHNGIVYKTPTVTNRKTLARCLGHAALPFGNGWGIEKSVEYVEWYTHEPNPDAGPKRVKNGFMFLTIKQSTGQITEEYFEQGCNQHVFINSYGTDL